MRNYNLMYVDVHNLKRSGAGLKDSTGMKKTTPKADSRVITGYCSVFGNTDSAGDIVEPGAFKKAIADFNEGRSRCRFLWNHDSKEPPIAKILELREVSKSQMQPSYAHMVDVKGALLVTREYFTHEQAERVYQGIVAGAITEMSFGFEILDFSYETIKGEKVRLLKSLGLYDASDVNWGCNSLTTAFHGKGPAIVGDLAKVTRLKAQIAERRDQKERIEQLKYSLSKYSSKPASPSMAELNTKWMEIRFNEATRRAAKLGIRV